MSSRFDRDPSIDKMLENDIRESFDKITPNEYMRQSILSDIEERDERSSGRKTAMQRLFAVRKVCLACLALIVMIALSGGTYSAVSMINGEKEEKKSEEVDNKNDDKEDNEDVKEGDNYRDRLVNFLYGKETSEYQFTREDWYSRSYCQVTDYRMAEAFENIDTEYEKIQCQDAEYTYIGMIAGEGISDMVFDKSEYHVFAAFVRENKEPVDWDYELFNNSGENIPHRRTFLTRKAESKTDELYEKIDFNKYSMECVKDSYNYIFVSYMSGNYEYDIIDVTSFLKYDDKRAIYCICNKEYVEEEERMKCSSMDEYVDNSFMIDMEEIAEDAPDLTYILKFDTDYVEKVDEMYDENDDDYNKEQERLTQKEFNKARKFRDKYPERLLSNKGVLCEGLVCENNDVPGYSMYDDDNNQTRRKFLSLEGIRIKSDDDSDMAADDIESITLSTGNATLYKKQNMTREDEKTASDTGSILGSSVKHYEVNDKDRLCEVYIDCGNRITIPYNQINVAGLYEYGICIEEGKRPDLNKCKTYAELFYAHNYWYADTLNNSDTRILVAYKDGYEEEFRLRMCHQITSTNGEMAYINSGWEQIR